MPEWRNWQTHQTQNLALRKERVGSTPTSGIIFSCVCYNSESNSKQPGVPYREALAH